MTRSHGTAKSVGALIALSVSAFTFVTTEVLPIGLLLPISTDLRTSPSMVGLLVTCYGLVVVLTSIPLTQLTRGIPRRRLLTGLLVVFVLATVLSALATGYWLLLLARVITALAQALFWSILVSTAAGLVSPQARGRAIAVVFAGSSLAAVLGVPAATWLGQQSGWRAAFGALSGLGILLSVAIAVLLPSASPQDSQETRGVTPDPRRYWTLLVVLTLAVTGSFVSFTYVTPFLAEVSLLAPSTIGPMLLVRGLAGLIGVAAGGVLVDRRPWAAVTIPVGLQAVALLALYLLGENPIAAVALIGVSGLTFAALTTALASLVLTVAPGSVDLAAAGSSTAVNIGITAGAFVGSLLLPGFGVRSTALVGGLLSLAALAATLAGRSPAPRRVPDTNRQTERTPMMEAVEA